MHSPKDDPNFRHGMAYAAHAILHAVGFAHEGDPGLVPEMVTKECCREEVQIFGLAVASSLVEEAGVTLAPHQHEQSTSEHVHAGEEAKAGDHD